MNKTSGIQLLWLFFHKYCVKENKLRYIKLCQKLKEIIIAILISLGNNFFKAFYKVTIPNQQNFIF